MAHPTRYVLTSHDIDMDISPMNLALLLKQGLQNDPSGASSRMCMCISAAGIGSSGTAYLGIHVEFPGALRCHSIKAEQFLVANLALHSEPDLTHLALSADDINFVAPSSQCFHFLREIHQPPNILIKNPSKEEYVTFDSLILEFSEGLTFNSLPPHPFPELAHLLEVRDNKLTFFEFHEEDPDGMKRAAIAAANRSFSPYRKSPSGVALKDRYQKVYRGWYMESIIPSSSLGPLQAALVDFMIKGGTQFDDIVKVVLVEKYDAEVGQEMTVKKILKKIAPRCDDVTIFFGHEP